MQQHQQDINAMACVIYNTYLAPSSSSELNIDHGLRAELVNYVATIKREAREKYGIEIKPDTVEDKGLGQIPLQASQISRLIVLYERIQAYIFRLMATDSVPKFVKTERFLNLMKTFEEYQETLINDKSTPPVPPLPKENEESNSSLRSHSVHSLRSSKKSQNSTEALANTTSNTSLGSKQSSREDS